jgi:hypothetical protein
LALAIFIEFGKQKNNTDLLYFGIALFAWVPGGMLGGFIAEKARPGTGSAVASFAFLSALLSISVAFFMA